MRVQVSGLVPSQLFDPHPDQADQFALRNAEWKSCLALIVETIRQEFGIAQKVEAQLYKLLVYEKGRISW